MIALHIYSSGFKETDLFLEETNSLVPISYWTMILVGRIYKIAWTTSLPASTLELAGLRFLHCCPRTVVDVNSKMDIPCSVAAMDKKYTINQLPGCEKPGKFLFAAIYQASDIPNKKTNSKTFITNKHLDYSRGRFLLQMVTSRENLGGMSRRFQKLPRSSSLPPPAKSRHFGSSFWRSLTSWKGEVRRFLMCGKDKSSWWNSSSRWLAKLTSRTDSSYYVTCGGGISLSMYETSR